MFTQDNIPKGLSFLKNIKNSVKQTPKTLSLKLYKKSFRGKGVTLFCNVGSDFLYLTERTHKPTAEGFAVVNGFNYKFSVKSGKLHIYQKKEILGRSIVRNAQMNFVLPSNYAKRFAPVFKIWLEQNGLSFKKINKSDNFLPFTHYNEVTYNVRRLCYPVLETITDKRYEFLKYCLYDSILTKYLRTHKYFKENQFLDYFFGYHGKKLKRLIYRHLDVSDTNNKYNVPIHLLSKGRLIKKLVSPETSIEFLSGQCVPSFTSWYSPLKFSRNFLSLLPDEQRNYLVARIKMQRDCHSLIDMSRAVNENPNTLDIIPKNRLLDIHEM
ncbi:MAG TPA: hypothetical protein PLP33_14795 [Leptospiraceae bacterium]|nr:hypothetical protein [Leptospiraceae bacterium]